MSERQFLILWLSRFAGRLRLIRRLRAGATITFWLLVIAALYQVLRAMIPYTEVMQALSRLLAIAAVGIVAYGLYRMARPTSLTQAASAADQAANLRDELKSAYWFVQAPAGQPAVELHMQRASRTAKQRDPRQILPLRIPKSAWGSLGLALLMGVFAWWSPQWAYSIKNGAGDSKALAILGTSVKPAASASSNNVAGGQGRSQEPPIPRSTKALSRSSAENDSPGDTDTDSKGAVDARLSGDGLAPPAGAAQSASSGTPTRRAAQNLPRESPSQWLGSVISRLKDLMQQGDEQTRSDDAAPEGSAQRGTRMAAAENGRNTDAGSSNPSPQYRDAERSGNTDMRLNSLGGTGPRNTLAGEGAGEEQSGRNNSNSGAMGQRVGTSRGGAGDEGDAPRGDPGGASESTPVLGRKTQRLAMQLKRVPTHSKSRSDAGDEDEGTPEAFFSATRSQASRVEPQGAEATPRATRSESTQTEQTPLAYRAVVKDYFLTQHRKEK